MRQDYDDWLEELARHELVSQYRHNRTGEDNADAAYFNYPSLGFVHNVLHASVNVGYNLRRQGKRFLADWFFIRQWRDLMSPRANIERHFAWLKRYFGLKYFRVQGYVAMTQFVFRVYIAALIVAFIAAHHQRPELATSALRCSPLSTRDQL